MSGSADGCSGTGRERPSAVCCSSEFGRAGYPALPLWAYGGQLKTFTPALQLHTLLVLNEQGRIVSTREPSPSAAPAFILIRGTSERVWATHGALSVRLASELSQLAMEEPPIQNFQHAPIHALRYVKLLAGRVDSGPAFIFPAEIDPPADVIEVENLAPLQRHFRGWTLDEIPARSPIVAAVDQGDAVSICFCARRSEIAAEAGVETAEPFRGRGLATRVTRAWAFAIRAAGLLPIYSTSWTNEASLNVARNLELEACASDWSLYR